MLEDAIPLSLFWQVHPLHRQNAPSFNGCAPLNQHHQTKKKRGMAGIQDYQAREHLLAVLQERGIPLGSDDVAWAFASPKTRDEIIAWVKEHLHEDTLLSSDEVEL
jgi:hypothetical protein